MSHFGNSRLVWLWLVWNQALTCTTRPTWSQNKWKTNEPPTKDENEDNSIIAGFLFLSTITWLPGIQIWALFHSFLTFTPCSLSVPWIYLIKPTFGPSLGAHPCHLGPSVFHLLPLIFLYQSTKLPQMPLFPHHSWVKNLLFSHWLPHSYKLFNSILGVKQITPMRVYLYIKAQTHGEYIKTQAHFNAVCYFQRPNQGEK